MRRRDLPTALLATAAGSTVLSTAQAQTCTAPCYPQTPQELAAGITPTNLAYSPGDVKRYGAVGDGITNDTAAFTQARTVTSGRYFISPGSYLVDSTPNVWEDEFFTVDNTTLKIGTAAATPIDISAAFSSGWQYRNTQRHLTIRHARTGADIMILSDGERYGDSHRVFLAWDIRRNSHALIMAPASNGDVSDVLWRRSPENTDPQGNRFSIAFQEGLDRWSVNYATTAYGVPNFDMAIGITAGTAPAMVFPALTAQFNQGIEVKQRATGGYRMAITPQPTKVQFKDADTGNVSLTLRDQCVGFYGSDGTSRQTVTGSKGGNAALASLITKLANLGLIVDGTT